MKTQAKKRAVRSADRAAQALNHFNTLYRQDHKRSSGKLKEQIGELLLYLQTPLSQEQQKEYWAQFESMLSQYLGLKICGGRI